MNWLSLFENYETLSLLLLGVFAFTAGFLDAVVGGGGLIQLPALLIQLPGSPVATLFGTNKIAALAGTSVSAVSYARRIRFHFPLLAICAAAALISAFLGAKAVTYLDSAALRPLILVLLVLMAGYTYYKKDLGTVESKSLPFAKQALYGALLSLLVGFYDGFFGPGTGSFFVLGFVVLLGFEFVKASAYAKAINVVTNLSALVVFVQAGHYLLELALMLAVCNVAGNLTGTRLALRRGNGFVRKIFLLLMGLMIARYGYDLWQSM